MVGFAKQNRGLHQSLGTAVFWLFGLAALSDDAEAVVVKVSEAVGSSLDEFHFSMEAAARAARGRRPSRRLPIPPSPPFALRANGGFGEAKRCEAP